MRRIVRAAGLLILAAGLFLLGAATVMLRGGGDSAARLELRNASGKPIQRVEISVESCGERKYRITDVDPPAGGVLGYALPLCGEGGVTIRVVHPDGSAVSSQGVYVESGYHVDATLEATGIKTSDRLFGY